MKPKSTIERLWGAGALLLGYRVTSVKGGLRPIVFHGALAWDRALADFKARRSKDYAVPATCPKCDSPDFLRVPANGGPEFFICQNCGFKRPARKC